MSISGYTISDTCFIDQNGGGYRYQTTDAISFNGKSYAIVYHNTNHASGGHTFLSSYDITDIVTPKLLVNQTKQYGFLKSSNVFNGN